MYAIVDSPQAVAPLGVKRNSHAGGWSEERIELLKKLWLEGLSASQIAGVLGEGVTRNGVIGKVHRLKLGGRANDPNKHRAYAGRAPRRVPNSRNSNLVDPPPRPRFAAHKQPRRTLREAVAMASPQIEDVFFDLPRVAELYIPVERRLNLMQVSEDTCRWPIGDPLTPDFYFCGQHADDGPYCEFHGRRAFNRIDKKRR